MTTLQELNAYELAKIAEVATPDTMNSAGAAFLVSVYEQLNQHLTECEGGDDDHQDAISEIADSAPDIYTYQKWLEFVDLCAWQSSEEAFAEYGSVDDMDKGASMVLYYIAEQLCVALLADYVKDDA